MTEAVTHYVVQFEEGFPRAEVEALGAELMAAGILAPGFIPPPGGLYFTALPSRLTKARASTPRSPSTIRGVSPPTCSMRIFRCTD